MRSIYKALVTLASLSCALFAHAGIEYSVTDIGVLHTGKSITPWKINNNTVVVGSAFDSGNVERAFKWSPVSSIAALTDISGGHGGRAFDINDNDVAVGISWDSIWDGEAVMWSAGGTLTNLTSAANETGGSPTIAPNGTIILTKSLNYDPSNLWKYLSGTWTNITSAAGLATGTVATGVNDAGMMSLSNPHSSFFKANAVYTLPTLGGTQTINLDINLQGQMAGNSYLTGNTYKHAFLWTPVKPYDTTGSILDLGTLGGDNSGAREVNAWGVVVGDSEITTGVNTKNAFIYRSACSGMQNLNDLIDPSLNITLQIAMSINDKGEIICIGKNSSNHTRAFLLQPL